MTEINEIERKFDSARQMLKTTGILSIVFGSIGTLFGLLITIAVPSAQYELEPGVFAVIVFLFWVAPHIFLIISGAQLLQQPAPSRARGLTIATLVIGALWNIILLIFGILALIQMSDYENGFKKSK